MIDIKPGLRIAVVGDVMLDEYNYCETLGVSPEDDAALKLRVARTTTTLGGAANVAAGLRALGAEVALFSRFRSAKRDRYSERLCELLSEQRIRVLYCSEGETTVKRRFVTQRHQRQIVRVDSEDTTEMCAIDALQLSVALEREQWDAVVVSDYAKGVVTETLLITLRRLVAHQNTCVFVDPKRPLVEYGGVSYLTPNMKEFETSCFRCIPDPAKPPTEIWLEGSLVASKHLVVTAGVHGCLIYDRRNAYENNYGLQHVVPVRAREMADSTGCGDSFLAGLVVVHVGAALKHHFVDRDDVLRRMLPFER
jgi:D-beta-D-heptose 7-phosphate kinase/D-beta-D-heptose 1-phosphate adenosyltransferase